MRLQTELVLEQARLKDLKIVLSEEDPRITLGVRARLTTEVAEAFGCRDLVYVNNTPRSGVDKMALDGEQIDVGIHLKNDNFAFAATANSMGNYVVKFEGPGPVLEFKIKLTGYAGILTDVAERVKVDPLEITLKPAQMDLGLAETVEDAAEETDDSERLISPEQAADTTAADDDAAPTPITRRSRKRTGRTPAPEELAAEQAKAGAEMGEPEEDPDFVSELVN